MCILSCHSGNRLFLHFVLHMRRVVPTRVRGSSCNPKHFLCSSRDWTECNSVRLMFIWLNLRHRLHISFEYEKLLKVVSYYKSNAENENLQKIGPCKTYSPRHSIRPRKWWKPLIKWILVCFFSDRLLKKRYHIARILLHLQPPWFDFITDRLKAWIGWI